MFTTEHQCQNSDGGISQLIELIETIIASRSIEEFAKHILPGVLNMTHSPSVFLYLADSRFPASRLFKQGLQLMSDDEIKRVCAEQLNRISNQAKLGTTSISISTGQDMAVSIILFALWNGNTCTGLLGLITQAEISFTPPNHWEKLLRMSASTIGRLVEREKSQRQLAHLNAYMTVSSMLSHELGLHDLLEIALCCSMEVVSAEAASILILDDEKRNFSFYQVEGAAKPVLMTTTFPADKGIAGYVLRTQCSEIINDVQNDPRFYKAIDSESGFQTRNIIATPLVAGQEPIGVLEVLNKVNGGSFAEEEHLILSSIAEEIAFAIRNAKIFEHVVNSYCKQRQGQNSCKGCKRPLGSWTPCVKYRNVEV